MYNLGGCITRRGDSGHTEKNLKDNFGGWIDRGLYLLDTRERSSPLNAVLG